MTSIKRKKQLAEAQKRFYVKKKEDGRVCFKWMIKPEWRDKATEFFKKLEKNLIKNKGLEK